MISDASYKRQEVSEEKEEIKNKQKDIAEIKTKVKGEEKV